MALVLADRVRETTTTAGTGAVSLAGAVSGFQTFSVAIGNANTTYYTIADPTTGAWEVGIGTYTASGNTLSRDTVLSSSNSGNLVNFASNAKDVFVTQPAGRAVFLQQNGTGLQTGAAAFTANRVVYADATTTANTSANLTFDGTTLTAANFADSSLTSGRVTYAGAGGNLTDSANLTFDGTTLTATAVADSSLTSGRVTYAGAGGNLTDSANLTFDGTTLTAANFADSSLTSGRVTFAGASGNLEDSANLTWNGTTLGITGALTASSDSSFTSTGALLISKGTAGQQPGAPATGMIRYNTTSNEFEGYSGSSPSWKSIGGSALSNDTATSTNLYPVFSNATTGTAQNLYTSNAKLLYKPSTGELQASEIVASNGLLVNSTTVSASYTVATGTNALSVGPITVASGAVLTVASGQRHIII
jgi:hypothetical protein